MACPTGKLTVESKDPRINYNLLPGEKLLTCPYVPAHALLPIKFPAHVLRCHRAHVNARAKEGKESLFSICKYDRSHHVRNEELEYHHSICEAKSRDSFGFEAWDDHDVCASNGYGASGSGSGSGASSSAAANSGRDGSFEFPEKGNRVEVVLPTPPEVDKAVLESAIDEDWDEEPVYTRQFDPDKRVMECRKAGYAVVQTHKVVGLTRSEKKEFYEKDAELMADLQKHSERQRIKEMCTFGRGRPRESSSLSMSSRSTITSFTDDFSYTIHE